MKKQHEMKFNHRRHPNSNVVMSQTRTKAFFSESGGQGLQLGGNAAPHPVNKGGKAAAAAASTGFHQKQFMQTMGHIGDVGGAGAAAVIAEEQLPGGASNLLP